MQLLHDVYTKSLKFEPKMESKPRGTGAVAAGRVYEEFEPKMEWDRQLGVDTLRVLLPGLGFLIFIFFSFSPV